MLPFTCGEKKNWYRIKNSQNIMSIIVDLPDKSGGLKLRFLTPEVCSFLPVGPQFDMSKRSIRKLVDHN